MAEFLKSLWNYKINMKEKSSARVKAVKGIVGFFVLMLVLSIFSRAANAMTIPRVTVETASKKNIDHSIDAKGSVEPSGEQAVSTVDGLKIKAVHVVAGSKVEAGAPLIEIDMEALNEKIRAQEVELETLNLEIADAKYNKNLKDNEKSLSQNKAREDYNTTAAIEDEKVNTAYAQMINAYNALTAFQNNPPSKEEEEGQSSESDLRAAYDEKVAAYNAAVGERDQQMIAKKWAIEEADGANEKTSTVESAALKKEAPETKLNKYRKLQEQNGIISSPVSGVVTSIDEAAATGKLTPETELMLISDNTAGLKFVTQITKDQQKYVARGDEVVLALRNNKELSGLTVDSITRNKDDDQKMNVTVKLEASDDVQVFDAVSMKVKNSSKVYDTCIPKTALHKGENGAPNYVLGVREVKTVLGQQFVAEKVNVTVQEENDNYAALKDNELAPDQKFIVDTDKEISDGDKVRLTEKPKKAEQNG